ncbi:hypothetical protein HK102_005970 [Quaeritorhiza haematococci]|nr:hypothetical protein HK102_005970 [Quaeritorhiza haematococci]
MWNDRVEFSSKQTDAESGGTVSNQSASVDACNPAGRKCALFWDYENAPVPSGVPGYVVVEHIRKVVHHFGAITLFKAYLQIGETTKKSLRSELQSSGILHTTHGNYNIVLIVPNKGAATILKSQANTVLEWRYDVLNQDVIQALSNPSPDADRSVTSNGVQRSGFRMTPSGSRENLKDGTLSSSASMTDISGTFSNKGSERTSPKKAGGALPRDNSLSSLTQMRISTTTGPEEEEPDVLRSLLR